MPEMQFTVHWPDDSVMRCYSPSLVIREYFTVGERYAVDDFVARSREALTIASERVRAKFGYPCANAMRQLDEIDAKAAVFANDAFVRVVGFTPP